ncbi:PA0061/PA0062 family lipoprotein [Halopseudomonas xiamenensis]|uniref:PA0061/PA0062 family lipoprotein n=1 Tax=Halopseudomonas xiamenensis TaxID=157792 RepID=UPI00162433F3|nr:hypothetical protein [Halopseudomonas xiamenensis]
MSRSVLLFSLFPMLAACAQPAPLPLDQGLARVNLESSTRGSLQAYRLDGELLHKLRFPDLTPGPHRLQMRYRFEVPGASSGMGERLSGSHWRRCILALDADFTAGEHYRISAWRLGWRAHARLENAAGEQLARAQVLRCGPGV